MKINIIDRSGDGVIIFFLGWGFDDKIFSNSTILDRFNLFCSGVIDGYCEKNYDIAILYDYRGLEWQDIQRDLDSKYSKKIVFAWSMGVWACENIEFKGVQDFYAINGTSSVAHNIYGIPISIYDSTMESLSSATLSKFVRRVCDNSSLFNLVKNIGYRQDIEALKEELFYIKSNSLAEPKYPKLWRSAYVSEDDKIFPFANMEKFWSSRGVKFVIVEWSHFPFFNRQESL